MPTEPPGVLIAGGLVRQLRKRAGANLVTFAPKCGITFQYLSQIELGVRTSVSPEVFVAICDALGVDDRDSLVRKEPVPA